MGSLMRPGALAWAAHATLLLIVGPGPAAAEDASRFAWGIPGKGADQSVLSLEPCNRPCVVVVRFDNRLVTSGYLTGAKAPAETRTTLAAAGLEVAVTVETGGGMTPDHLRVRPPPGYRVEPLGLPVEENATGRVRVLLEPMG